jgi:hypothetical protein
VNGWVAPMPEDETIHFLVLFMLLYPLSWMLIANHTRIPFTKELV